MVAPVLRIDVLQLLPRSTPSASLLPVSKLDDAISFAIQIAEALQEAHAKGIVQIEHRTPGVWEENPGNIRVNIRTTGALKSATLVGGILMDGDESNNTWTSK